MRVGLDAHMIGQQETGNETYARGLLTGLARVAFPVDVYSFDRLPLPIHRSHRIRPRHSALRIPVATPLLAIRDQLDVFHATYVLPPILTCASVVTIHDITYLLHPEWFAPRVQRMLATLVPLAIRKASHVITISESSKRDIVERYGVQPGDVSVTYLAPRPEFAIAPDAPLAADPFFLYVGNVEPRKNFRTVVEALALLRQGGLEIPVVVAGKLGHGVGEIVQQARSLGVDNLIDFRGYVPDEELRALYATCIALVHPALYEGFGLTLVEAMVQGAPVLVANTSSVPEVVDDAAVLLPACDAQAWCDAMALVLTDANGRSDLVTRGRARASTFSWEECARQTIAIYQSVAS